MLIVGAGFSGSVVARILAEAGRDVVILEERDHIGGNAYDYYNSDGILVHKYGPHAFHTNSKRIYAFLSRFTEWRPFSLRVQANIDGMIVPLPVNATTISRLFGRDAEQYLAEKRVFKSTLANSEDVVLSRVGPDLCEKIFRHYTKKQWGLDLKDLDPSVAARIPVRTDTDDRYFTDEYQAVPKDGYTKMFERMLDHPRIRVTLNTSAFGGTPHVWTGPIDRYFDYTYGRLPYRSLRFEHLTLPLEQVLPSAIVTYPDPHHAYTRITEFKHITGQHHPMTTVCAEYPCADGDPYYPVPMAASQALYSRYAELARTQIGVTFVGRLAQYRYYNMDQAVGAAMTAAERILG